MKLWEGLRARESAKCSPSFGHTVASRHSTETVNLMTEAAPSCRWPARGLLVRIKEIGKSLGFTNEVSVMRKGGDRARWVVRDRARYRIQGNLNLHVDIIGILSKLSVSLHCRRCSPMSNGVETCALQVQMYCTWKIPSKCWSTSTTWLCRRLWVCRQVQEESRPFRGCSSSDDC